MKILFASAEVSPFAKTGGLGDVSGALPKALRHLGHDVFVFCPFYRDVRLTCERRGIALENRGGSVLHWGGWTAPYEVLQASLPGSDVPIFFIVNDHFFDREGLYWGAGDGTDDNLEKYTFFCRAVIAAVERLDLRVDIVHAHDWQTALLPIYLRAGLRFSSQFSSARSVYTIHNLNYQGRFPADRFRLLGLREEFMRPDALEYYGDLVLMKGGITFADRVTTVSPTYAREIQTSRHGAGFDGLLRDLSWKLSGIVNGIDAEEWNPETDALIPANFSARSLEGKAACRKALRKEAGLAPTPRTPVLAAISRLVEQKGFDLFVPLVPSLVRSGWQLVILGTGERDLENALHEEAARHPGQVHVWTRFDPALAHRIIAGSDAIVIPSRYEPCGLNQMYGLRYGTLPVVRRTGGLADTVVPYDGSNPDRATGFAFEHEDREGLAQALLLARVVARDRPLWTRMQKNGMAVDFSWDASAKQYEALYADVLAG